RIGTSFRAPHGKNFRNAAGYRNGVNAIEVRIGVTRRLEEDFLAVGSPADNDIGRGVPGQAAGFAAIRGHDVGIDVAVIFAGEGDPLSVGRKIWAPLMAAGCELTRFTAASGNAP